MTLIERITEKMYTDDENFAEKQSELLIEAYETADQAGKALLDTAFICLCGYSLTTMLARVDDPEDDEHEERF